MNRIPIAELNTGGPDRPGPGERLKLARQAWGMSIEQVAATLRLPVSVIGAIEREDYQGLPPGAYVRGYVSGYARLVSLDAAALLADCEMRGCGAPKLTARRSLSLHRKGAETLGRWGSYAALAGFVVAALGFWVNQGREQLEPSPQPAVTEAQTAAPAVPDATGDSTGDATALTSGQHPQGDTLPPGNTVNRGRHDDPPSSGAVTAVAHTAPVPAPAPSNAIAATPGITDWATLELSFDADSWIAVLDRNGKRIAWETVKAGSSRSLSGPPPLKVVLGNAASVHISYAGEPFDPSPYTEGRIARFSVE